MLYNQMNLAVTYSTMFSSLQSMCPLPLLPLWSAGQNQSGLRVGAAQEANRHPTVVAQVQGHSSACVSHSAAAPCVCVSDSSTAT